MDLGQKYFFCELRVPSGILEFRKLSGEIAGV